MGVVCDSGGLDAEPHQHAGQERSYDVTTIRVDLKSNKNNWEDVEWRPSHKSG